MDIDWFTFAAQIVNFLVLVALLRWLLYDRIVRAMKRREEKIADRLKQADQKRAEAETRVKQYEEKRRQFDQQREELLKEARRAVQQERQQLLRQAKEDVNRQREKWHEEYRRGRDDLLSDVRRQAGQMALHAARRTLAQLADAELEERICNAFASRVEQLNDEQREEIVRHLGNGQADVSLRSAFELSDEWRRRLGELIRKTFSHDAEISFEKEPDLICGVQLDVGGYSFGWNVREFLHDLELEFDERLKSIG